MHVDVADAFSVKAVTLDESENLLAISHHGGGQILKQFQDRRAIREASASDLSEYKGMHDDDTALEQIGELRIALAKVIDPDRRVDQDQDEVSWRLRGAAFSWGWVPPSRARRRALSRSMRALRPSRTIADRSRGPVSLTALASRSSSMLMVVRMSGSRGWASNVASIDVGVRGGRGGSKVAAGDDADPREKIALQRNWRLIFRFEDGDAVLVDYRDCH